MSLAARHATLAAIVATLSAALLGGATAPPAAAASCAYAGSLAGQVSSITLERSTLCLLNSERTRRGLPALRSNWRLQLAARRHSADMARNDYFSHDSLSGASFIDRIRRTGYLRGARAWAAGENIAWGSGSYGSPRSIMRGLMNSPGHRRNILSRTFREIGVGVAFGAPRRVSSPAATYTQDFGYRR